MENMTKTLIIGGYGFVGFEVAKILSTNSGIKVYISGRNKTKAEQKASEIGVSWKYIDISDKDSIRNALDGIDVVVNCYNDINSANIIVAEMACDLGIKYLDVAGIPMDHLKSIKALHQKAIDNNALLMTGIGLNPGMVGVVLKNHCDSFDEILDSEVFFTLGSDMEDMSVLSIRGMSMMMSLPPKFWNGKEWIKPMKSSVKSFVGDPINRDIYFGPGLITPDIESITDNYKIESIKIWSGVESLYQSIVMLIGIKLGFASSDKKASKLLKYLKSIGSNKKFHLESHILVNSTGFKDGKKIAKNTSFYCSEVFATALAISLVCIQLSEGIYQMSGAFYPTDIIDHIDFIKKLESSNINFKEEFIEM